MAMAYGKFASFEDFLTSYVTERKKREAAEDELLSFSAQRRKKRQKKERDVVEVIADVRKIEEDETSAGKHQHLRIKLTEVVDGDPDVDADLEQHVENDELVFVAIRYGDRMGLPDRIEELAVGMSIQARGEWIPKDKAYAHGGEKMSVLHFTPEPIGFICTPEACYS